MGLRKIVYLEIFVKFYSVNNRIRFLNKCKHSTNIYIEKNSFLIHQSHSNKKCSCNLTYISLTISISKIIKFRISH